MARKSHPPKKNSTHKRNVEANSYIEGSTNLEGGDYIGGDKVSGLQPDQVIGLIDAIRKNLVPYYQDPERFESALQEFQKLHKALYEWKELHNLLDEIINSFNQYHSQVERLNVSSVKPNLRDLRLLWKPVSMRVNKLVEFAKGIKLIGEPYAEEQGHLKGELWVLEILSLKNDLEKIINPDEPGLSKYFSRVGWFFVGFKPQWWNTMYELTDSFFHAAYMHLHWGDKELRDSAAKLYHLSEAVFQRQ